jgi:hypothetical protein
MAGKAVWEARAMMRRKAIVKAIEGTLTWTQAAADSGGGDPGGMPVEAGGVRGLVDGPFPRAAHGGARDRDFGDVDAAGVAGGGVVSATFIEDGENSGSSASARFSPA